MKEWGDLCEKWAKAGEHSTREQDVEEALEKIKACTKRRIDDATIRSSKRLRQQ
jgi:hypothetical protein